MVSSNDNIFGNDGPSSKMANFNRPPPMPAHGLEKLVNQSLLCFCNFGPPICEFENACIKHDRAACFHSAKLEYDDPNGAIGIGILPQMQHLFGCAPLERGADGSHLTCNSWRSSHSNPQSIACCYEGNYCNRDLALPSNNNFPRPISTKNGQYSASKSSDGFEAILFMAFGFLIGFALLLAIFLPIRYFWRKGKIKKMGTKIGKDDAAENGTLLPQNGHLQFSKSIIEDSGSGSAGVTLNQRTIALDLEMLEVFARGRYGELRKAVYRGSMVAVKIFYTTEEESWRNEREIYLSQMLNHENILQYVAADIMSSVESMTQMILVVDYHPLGSLYDYLRADFPLNLQEALGLAFTTISGLEHLHNPVQGTGGRRKPEIAHRDIKSKNVLVKRPFVCCLADFGLAVRLEEGSIFPQKVNVQVGTKRYMAPELLADSLNPANFEEFKWADIYSFSLVLWEIMNRVEPSPDAQPIPIPSNNVNNNIAGHQRLMSHSNSSGFLSASDSNAANPIVSFPFAHHRPSILPPNSAGGDSIGQIGTSSAEVSEEWGMMGTPDGTTKTIGANTSGTKIRRQQHSLPFQSIAENDPTLEQMRDIICHKKIRPPMKPEWTNGGNNQLNVLGELMAECWREQGRSRHTALKLKKELARLISGGGDGRGPK